MSTTAQAIMVQFEALPPSEQRELCRALEQRVAPNTPPAPAQDPIRSARGMFAGSGLLEALLASRAEERRRG